MKAQKIVQIFVVVFAMIMILPMTALADSVGWVCGMDGESTIERPGKGTVKAMVGIGVEMGDIISTGNDGRCENSVRR